MQHRWKKLDIATRRGHKKAPATSFDVLARSQKPPPGARETVNEDGVTVNATTLQLTAELREREAARGALAARVDAARAERAAAEARATAAVRPPRTARCNYGVHKFFSLTAVP
jgi:hypothetical protein